MKKKIVSICLVAALVAIAAFGSLAYFTDTDQRDNVFTVGNVDITLTESKWDCSGSKAAEDTYPGQALPKNPAVSNDGSNPCFVRIKVDGLDCLGEDYMITYETNNVPGALGRHWTLYSDGYFYYHGVLETGRSTSDLFDQIRIPTNITGGVEGEFDVSVQAQAVQAQGAKPTYAEVQRMSVAEIAEWFATCGVE